MTRKTRRQPFQRKISWKWTQEKGFRLKVHTAQCPGGSQNIFSPQFEVAFDDRGKKKQWEANAVVNQGREREVWVCSFVKLPNRTQAVHHHHYCFCILGLTAKNFDVDSKCFQKVSILFQNGFKMFCICGLNYQKISRFILFFCTFLHSDGIFQGSSTHNTLREMVMMIWWCKVKKWFSNHLRKNSLFLSERFTATALKSARI